MITECSLYVKNETTETDAKMPICDSIKSNTAYQLGVFGQFGQTEDT